MSDLGDARSLDDLRAPGLRLHALRGDLAGWWSVAIDRRWRLIFRWIDDAAHDVDIVDYH